MATLTYQTMEKSFENKIFLKKSKYYYVYFVYCVKFTKQYRKKIIKGINAWYFTNMRKNMRNEN